ncbi:RNA-binding protein 12 [Ditylenchus destructor]|uniref:RNA-binding protein 12 n=1 Tax=Ditylenchus destructor TaxID=166010 RepID=A0AAD4N709_9BILA|nr:RNA-binding protein 12 [Ditylenchus destructor]
MSIIIRLQNLPLSAKAADIREFFGDLKIPKGAVNIVGGSEGDAFIGFASDEDARLAMRLDQKSLHSSKIKLLLSSRAEMEGVISKAHAMAAAVFSGKPNTPPSSATTQKASDNGNQENHKMRGSDGTLYFLQNW